MKDWRWKEIELGNDIWFGCYCEHDVMVSFENNEIKLQYDPPRDDKVNLYSPLIISRNDSVGKLEGMLPSELIKTIEGG